MALESESSEEVVPAPAPSPSPSPAPSPSVAPPAQKVPENPYPENEADLPQTAINIRPFVQNNGGGSSQHQDGSASDEDSLVEEGAMIPETAPVSNNNLTQSEEELFSLDIDSFNENNLPPGIPFPFPFFLHLSHSYRFRALPWWQAQVS